MLRKIFLLFALVLLLRFTANAAVFVVTSNADSGAGTLRQALLDAAANGSAEKDYINFNLPDLSEAGRTITLVTGLPNLSSNLDIDGSTQQGIYFGRSQAKIKIATPFNYNAITVFNGSGLTQIAFYGLYIYDDYDILTSYPDLKTRAGIKLKNCTQITIGSRGKGNMTRGFVPYCIQAEDVDILTIKSNIIGLGKSNNFSTDNNVLYGGYTGFLELSKCNNISLGGDSDEGNLIFTPVDIDFYQETVNNISIRSNNFLVYQDGVSTEWYFSFGRPVLKIDAIFSSSVKTTEESLQLLPTVNIDFYNNISGSQINFIGIRFIKGVANFKHNFFNIARDGLTDIRYGTQLPQEQYPVNIENSKAQFNFGTNDPNDKNYFNNISTGIVAAGAPNVFLRYNDFRCVRTSAYENTMPRPLLSISEVNSNGLNTSVKGISDPLAIIDIYSSESCSTECSVRSYLQTVTADAAGKWQADISNLNGIFYAAATLNNVTSTFKTLSIDAGNAVIDNIRCTDYAHITGLKIPAGVTYYWEDRNGVQVGNTIDLEVNKAGAYRLVIGGGCIKSNWFDVFDYRVIIDTRDLVTENASCTNANGSIKGLVFVDPLSRIASVAWRNSANEIVSGSANAINLKPGNYIFTVTTNDGCSKSYGPITLTNTTGPNVNQASATVTPTNCGQSIGSITGITATGTGTLKYSWKNQQQQVVGTSRDLLNQPAGKYVLQVADDTQCGPVYTTTLEIAELNGIAVDESARVITLSSCSNNNGAITGIKAPGATQYRWTDVNNITKGSTLDLSNVPSGDYTFTASNTFGCIQIKTYHIGQQAATIYPTFTASVVNSCYGLNNGSISISTNAIVKSARWTNSQDVTKGSGNNISNLAAGAYKLYFTDINGCESLYNTFNITEIAELKITTANITHDECGLKNGSIKNVQITGGVPPYSYSWTNSNNSALGSSADLDRLGGGVYRLVVTDSRNCAQPFATYTIQDNSAIITAPIADDIQTCSAGKVILAVNNSSSVYKYRLYDAENAAVPLDEQTSGRFVIDVKNNASYFISQLQGTCESVRTQVRVTVGITKLDIANTFTPNADGVNDYWKITGIESSPNAVVQVYNRGGQLVFNSKGYANPFNGVSNGRDLPVGNYYYIINMGSACGILSGTITIIR